ncbi:hypothetical protein DL1_08680 [Thioclava dalianensis]|uniref:Uncharacterized protein n=1 Tax=Thioclava dalianensis TaxID=1185766 RepID=A0A074TAX2_9RHOB|nr:hypothetical protein [Thioclava dalianensis]KEP68834.1 hypothetical protein DL1_08680 [Thioclava dalianensis]SFN49214.1 hypothetical protein SAMN05216224_10653 [Thioclava dalianensis]
MREPTPIMELYAWHRAALAGEDPPLHDGQPECGWFKTKLVKGGPWVAARIWVEREIDPETGELAQPETYRCEIDGERRNAENAWSRVCKNPITRGEHDALIAMKETLPEMRAVMKEIDLTKEPMRP